MLACDGGRQEALEGCLKEGLLLEKWEPGLVESLEEGCRARHKDPPGLLDIINGGVVLGVNPPEQVVGAGLLLHGTNRPGAGLSGTSEDDGAGVLEEGGEEVELGAPSLECEPWLSLQVDKLSSIEHHTRGHRHCKGEGGQWCTACGAKESGVALPLFLFLGQLESDEKEKK
ncbi:hypothetical protein M405DRAFT_847921, partial [Rhizopogon salebrosus TDB-379]